MRPSWLPSLRTSAASVALASIMLPTMTMPFAAVALATDHPTAPVNSVTYVDPSGPTPVEALTTLSFADVELPWATTGSAPAVMPTTAAPTPASNSVPVPVLPATTSVTAAVTAPVPATDAYRLPASAAKVNPALVKLLVKAFGNEAGEALIVANCESGLDYGAVGRPNRDGTRDWGLFQFNDGGTLQGLLRQTGEDPSNVSKALDPTWSIKAAKLLYQRRAWQPWVCAWKVGLLDAMYSSNPGPVAGKVTLPLALKAAARNADVSTLIPAKAPKKTAPAPTKKVTAPVKKVVKAPTKPTPTKTPPVPTKPTTTPEPVTSPSPSASTESPAAVEAQVEGLL